MNETDRNLQDYGPLDNPDHLFYEGDTNRRSADKNSEADEEEDRQSSVSCTG